MNRVLLVYKKENSSERVVEFIQLFATHASTDIEQRSQFISAVIRYDSRISNCVQISALLSRHLISCCPAKDKAVRLQSVGIIGAILQNLPEDAEIECVNCI